MSASLDAKEREGSKSSFLPNLCSNMSSNTEYGLLTYKIMLKARDGDRACFGMKFQLLNRAPRIKTTTRWLSRTTDAESTRNWPGQSE